MWDLTPGFNLGVSDAVKNATKTGNSVGKTPSTSSKTGATNYGSTRPTNTTSAAENLSNGAINALKGGGTGAVSGVLGAAAAPGASNAYGASAPAYSAAARNALLQRQGNIFGTADSSANLASQQYGNSVLDFINSLTSGQQSIDRQAANNELGRMNNQSSILDTVSKGIRSGQTMLGNRNAGNSSAAGDIAKAYAESGRKQLTGVNQDYLQGQEAVAEGQQQLDQQRASGLRSLDLQKNQSVEGIVSEARNALADLDAAMVDASLPDRIEIQREAQNIRNNVLSALSGYDQQLQSGTQGVQARSADANRAEAARLAGLGQVPEGALTYQNPIEVGGIGNVATNDLPIYLQPRRNDY